MSDRLAERVTARLQVLVVGESDRTRATHRTIEEGFGPDSVATVRSVDEATAHASDVDCFVCDAGTESAVRTIEQLRDRTQVPVLAISDGDDEAVIAAGAIDVLSQSDSVAVVRARIRTAIDAAGTVDARDELDRYRSLLAAASTVVVTDDGEITWASPRVTQAIGYTPAELVGDDLIDFVHPDDIDSVRTALESVTGADLDDRDSVSCRIRHGDGTHRTHLLVAVNRRSDPDVEGVVWTIESEKPPGETIETDVRPDAGTLADPQTILERIDDPVFVVDHAWTVTTANDAGRDVLIDVPDDVQGLTLWEHLRPDTVTTWFERLSEARERGTPVTFVVDRPDDALDVRAYPDGESIVVVARRRMQPEAARLRTQLEATASLLDTVPGPALLVEDGRVSVTNAATFAYTDRDAVVGHTVADVFDDAVADAITDRADSRIRRIDPIEWRPDDDHVIELSVVPLETGHTAVVGRDVSSERALQKRVRTLADTVEELRDSTSDADVRRIVLDGVRGSLDVAHAVWYRRSGDQIAPIASSSSAGSLDPPPLEWSPDRLGALEDGNATVLDSTTRIPLDDSASIRSPLAISIGATELILAGDDEPVVPGISDGVTSPDRPPSPAEPDDRARRTTVGGRPQVDTRASTESIGSLTGRLATLSLDHVATLAERRGLAHDRDRLEATLDRRDELLAARRAIDRGLREAPTRERVESSVCDVLATVSEVGVAWIGSITDGTIEVRTSAGQATAYLEAVFPTERSDSTEPAVRALDRGTVQVVDVDSPPGRSWELASARSDLTTLIAVPISGRSLTHGVLGVYTTGVGQFDDEFHSFCDDVATTVGLAIDSVETRDALLSTDRVDLDLSAPQPGTEVLSTLAVGGDTSIELDAVATGTDRTTMYLSMRDGDATSAIETLESMRSVAAISSLPDTEQTRLEVVVERPTLPDVLAEYGAVIQSVEPTDDGGLFRVSIPADRPVRPLLDAVTDRYPGVELLARRPASRGTVSNGHDDAVLSELTDRQREVLRTAYAAGYFEWPRERTGEEVAARLDISQPTFTRHFRAAERAVFGTLFEDE